MEGAGKSLGDAGIVNVKVMKKRDDENGVVRVSVGGGPGFGYYCVYRGTRQAAQRVLAAALAALHDLKEEPPISPDDGKRFA